MVLTNSSSGPLRLGDNNSSVMPSPVRGTCWRHGLLTSADVDAQDVRTRQNL
jgi:hypothetical protein